MTINHRPSIAEAPPRRRILLTLLTICSLVLAQLALTGSTATGAELDEPGAIDHGSDPTKDDHDKDDQDRDDTDKDDRDDRDRGKEDKVWVCKMVGQPDDARLSTGKNPIHVSRNATDGHDAFNDAHPSFVVSGPDDPACKDDKDKDPDKPVVKKGHLVITKVTIPAGIEQDFQVTLERGDATIGTRTFTGDGDSAELTVPAAKDYRLVEKVPAGWSPDYEVSCTIGSYPAIHDGKIKVLHGKTTDCMIVNRKLDPPGEPGAKKGHLVITKVTIPAGIEQDFQVTLERGDETIGTRTFTGDGDSAELTVPAAEDYRLVEKVPAGWSPDYEVTCTIGEYDVTYDKTFTVMAGKTTTCVIENVAIAPKVTVKKIVDNRFGGTAVPDDFTLLVNDEEVASGATTRLLAGVEYTVSEQQLKGYELIGITCSDGSGTEHGATFTPVFGDEILCKVVNRDLKIDVPKPDDPKPDISLDKQVVGGVVVSHTGDLEVRIKDDAAVKVTYDYVVTNTGEEDLSQLALVDDTLGDLTEALVAEVTTTYGDPILPVGKAVTVTASQEVTADDFDDGKLINVADVGAVGTVTKIEVTDRDAAKVVLVEVKDVVIPAPKPVPPVDVAPVDVAPVAPVPVPVTAPALPVTGTESGLYTALGMLLAALGTATLMFTPRRRKR